jgi:hypothetical protein
MLSQLELCSPLTLSCQYAVLTVFRLPRRIVLNVVFDKVTPILLAMRTSRV